MSQREADLLNALKACVDRLELQEAATRKAIASARAIIFRTEIAIAAEAARLADRSADPAYTWNLEEALRSLQ